MKAMDKTCVIFGAGNYDGAPVPADADLYIAADGGLDTMLRLGLRPHLLIGDLDSAQSAPPDGIPLLRLPTHKDITDTDAAVREAQSRGCGRFLLYGLLGGRPDHSFANITLLARLSQEGCRAALFGAGYVLTAVTDGALSFDPACGGYLSVFSFSDKCEGVTLKNLAYTMDNGALTNTFGLGVSNEFIGKAATVAVKRGTLLVMYERPAAPDAALPRSVWNNA